MNRFAASTLLALLLLGCGGEATAPEVAPEPDDTTTAPQPDAQAVDWLESHLRPFESIDVREDRSDLAHLDTLVGDARIVGLGEATHGTSEFFRVKHRILDHLVRELGFRVFAMEASFPEMNRIDRWVRGGPGDPEEWLSGQYFWMWNTREVLDLLLWARAFNEGREPQDQVRVLGFDMQFAGKPIHDIPRFLENIDTMAAREVREDLECYRIFANNEAGRTGAADYGSMPPDVQASCRSAIDGVVQRLAEHRDAWTAASSPEAYAEIERAARIIQQNEELARSTGTAPRDRFMAENVEWIADRFGPDARIVLWAHNTHVSTGALWMGGFLRERFGASYLPMALTFSAGSFHSRASHDSEVEAFTLTRPGPENYEFELQATEHDRFVVDLRAIRPDDPATRVLREVRRLRMVGTLFQGQQGILQPLTQYDALVFIRTSSPTTLLPFVYPPGGFAG